MRRYLFYFALAFAAALFLVLQFTEYAPVLVKHSPLIILLAVYGIYLARYFGKPMIICILAGLAAGGIYTAAYHTVMVAPLDALCERTMVMQAEVRADPDIYDQNQRVEVKVSCDSVGLSSYPGQSFSAIGYLPLTEEPLSPGDQVQVLVTFYQPTVRQGFDRQRYQMANGNFLSFSYLKNKETKEAALFEVEKAQKTPLFYRPQALARQFGSYIMDHLPEREGGFLYALLLGNRNYLDPLAQQNLQKVGLSHIIAVSGLHLMFLVGLIYRLFSRKIGVLISFIAILFFIPMAGASPSIIRAGITATLSGIAFLFGRESDGQTSLGAALLVLLCINPYALFSLSLELSFLSTFGILRYAGRLEHTLFGKLYAHIPGHIGKKFAHAFGAAVSCSLCAMLFTTPILVSAFGYITLLSIPANLMILGVISIIFGLGIFFCLFPFLTGVLVHVLVPLIDYVFWCAQTLGTQHWGILYWEETSGRLAVLSILLLIVLILAHRYVYPKISIPLCCCFLITATGYAYYLHSNTTRVTLHAVGDGQMISVIDGFDSMSLIDCGCASNQDGMAILRETMNWYGFSELDSVILTAVDKAHARNIAQVLTEIPVSHCILPNHVKESETLTALTQAAEQTGITLTVWEKAGESAYPLPGIAQTTLIGGIDRKLGVRLADGDFELLTLHSMTQNMLDALLTSTPLQSDRVVLDNSFEKQDYLQRALNQLQPTEIILSTGYGASDTLFDIPVRSTNLVGDLTWKIPHS